MVRISMLICALGWLLTTQAVPAPEASGKRAVLRVHHVHHPAGYTCPVHETGHRCRDWSHWSIAVDKQAFDLSKSDEACVAAVTVVTQDANATVLKSDSDASVLLCVDKTAPFIVVQGLTRQLSTLGFSRVSVRESADLPEKIVEVRLRISLDDDSEVVSRTVDGTPASDDVALRNLIKAVALKAKQTIKDPVVIVTVEAAPLVPWESVTATTATCRLDGVTAIETVVAEFE